VIAIFMFVYGALSLCGSVYGLIDALGGGSGSNLTATNGGATVTIDLHAEMEKQIPGYKAIKTVQGGLAVLLGLLVVLSGVGLLMLQGWGRWLALGWAVLDLLHGVIGMGFALFIELPALEKALSPLASVGGPGPMMVTFAKFGVIMGLGFAAVCLLLPVLTLIFLNREHVRRAFAGLPPLDQPAYADEPRDYFDRREPDEYDRDRERDEPYRSGNEGFRE
jgi:hypothetical protein